VPIAYPIRPETDPCLLVDRFKIDDRLAEKLVLLSWHLEFPISVRSGFRTEAEQDALRRSGRPAAPNDLSTHLSCPATGVDLNVGIAVTDVVRARLGTQATLVGLRWGGGSPQDPDTGIPSDWNHFDLGPRR